MDLLQQKNAESAEYDDLLSDILGLLRGTYRSADGLDPHPVPGTGADVEPWVLGSSAGESAEAAGRLGIRFAASYHISPATALAAADAYRAAFVPSAALDRPYVAVSADVVVAPDDESARKLAAGYAPWVRSIRKGEGAIPFPGPDEASRLEWNDEERALVRDRVETQFVGSPRTVAAQLEVLQEATGADELIVTTITHSHTDRIRSFTLLAQEWFSEVRPPDRAISAAGPLNQPSVGRGQHQNRLDEPPRDEAQLLVDPAGTGVRFSHVEERLLSPRQDLGGHVVGERGTEPPTLHVGMGAHGRDLGVPVESEALTGHRHQVGSLEMPVVAPHLDGAGPERTRFGARDEVEHGRDVVRGEKPHRDGRRPASTRRLRRPSADRGSGPGQPTRAAGRMEPRHGTARRGVTDRAARPDRPTTPGRTCPPRRTPRRHP